MRTALALALAALLSSVPLYAADPPHPDFTGSWLVDGVTTAGGGRDRGEGRRAGGGFGGGGRGFGRSRGGFGGPGRSGREADGRDRSRGPVDGDGFTRGERVDMTQTDTLLTVIVAPDAGGRVVRYPLDGADGYTSTPDGTPLRTRTSWQGVALVTDTQSTEKARPFKEREVRTMDAVGKVTIERTIDTPFGKRTTTVTLTKREG